MNIKRISAVIERDFRIIFRLKWRLIEIFYFPATMVIIWGLFTMWAQSMALQAVFMLLAINIFWSFAYHAQSGANEHIMEDRWTESFRQIITTPLRPSEYLVGKIAFSILFSLMSLTFTLTLAYFVFDYTIILENLGYFALFTFIILAGSIGITILIASIITILGNQYGFLGWSTTQLFILFSAPFFPMTVYPKIIQIIPKCIPFTYVFESIRMLISQGIIDNSILLKGVILGCLYIIFSIPFYSSAFEIARKRGKLVKLW